MKDRILGLAPKATLVSIENWVKKDPAYDVLRVYEMLCVEKDIDSGDGFIINYCDFYMTWDYVAFVKEARERNCDSAVLCCVIWAYIRICCLKRIIMPPV